MRTSPVRFLIVSLAVIIAVGLSFGPTSMVSAQRLKKLTWTNVLSTSSLDPAYNNRLPDWMNIMNIYSGLVKQKPGSLNEVLPDLAERWTVSPDGRTYTFHLRSGVKWHDGFGEFTAADVKYSWERILDPATHANNRADLGMVQAIEVVDPRTVRVTLAAPFPDFLATIGNSAFTYIVNRRAIAERGAQYAVRPIGTGPYKVQRAEARGGVVLVANPEYFGGKPPIDEVELWIVPEESAALLALRTGETDLMVVREYANIALLRRTANIIVNADDKFSASTYILELNNTRKPFDDVRVRRALAHALDRRAMMLRVGAGILGRTTNTIIPVSILGHTEDVQRYEHNPARARQLLREAGYPNGFKTSVIAPVGAYHPAILAIVQAMWRQVGVDLQIELLDSPALRPRQRTMDFDITAGDPLNSLVGQFLARYHSGGIPLENRYGYRNPQVDRLIDTQASEIDQQKRVERIRAIQRQVAIDLPGIPLFPTVQATAAGTHVKGLVPNLGWWQLPFNMMDIQR